MICFIFHNKFAFDEYIHVYSVVLTVWFVKCSQITKFTLKIMLLSTKKTSCESERDFRDTVNTTMGKPLAAAVGTFSSNMPLPI